MVTESSSFFKTWKSRLVVSAILFEIMNYTPIPLNLCCFFLYPFNVVTCKSFSAEISDLIPSLIFLIKLSFSTLKMTLHSFFSLYFLSDYSRRFLTNVVVFNRFSFLPVFSNIEEYFCIFLLKRKHLAGQRKQPFTLSCLHSWI